MSKAYEHNLEEDLKDPEKRAVLLEVLGREFVAEFERSCETGRGGGATWWTVVEEGGER